MPFLPIYDNNPRIHISRPYVVWSLIALNVLGFVWQISGGDSGFQTVVYRYGFIPAVFGGGAELPASFGAAPSLLTLVSSQFLHGDLFHLVFNMLFLWVFGDNIEDALGHGKFLVFYLLSGVVAALAHFGFNLGSEVPVIGASGAISGVLGAYLLLYPRAWVLTPVAFMPLMLPAGLMLLFWFGMQLLNVFEGDASSNVAWWAHIGGFVVGLALVGPMKRPMVPLFGGHRPPKSLRVDSAAARRRRRPEPARNQDAPDSQNAPGSRETSDRDPWAGKGPWNRKAGKPPPSGRKGPWG
ncbi:rhomboid family intramembrane serine protease [Algihabitans albus]|uniref:rhomboid family intramembrane serine protease n=1 Tax=Algihabitans albus TaxID=2164067 RepID=UPI000E5CA507|nr:rhomboid family intramembrane serine protease [Algihabitans albus]